MDRKVWIVLGAVLTVMVVGFVSVIVLTRSSDDGGDPGPGPLAVACVEAGGQWLGYRCKTAVEIENELRERDRIEFCSNLPQRLPISQIPERCRDFYGPPTSR